MLSSSCELHRPSTCYHHPVSSTDTSSSCEFDRRIVMLSSSCEFDRRIGMLSSSCALHRPSTCYHHPVSSTDTSSSCELDRHIDMLSSSCEWERHIDMLSSSCEFDRHIIILSWTDTSRCYHHLVILCSPNEYFGRIDKRRNPDFEGSIFHWFVAQIEYSPAVGNSSPFLTNLPFHDFPKTVNL